MGMQQRGGGRQGGWMGKLLSRVIIGGAVVFAAAAPAAPTQTMPASWLEFARMAGSHLQARLGNAPATLAELIREHAPAGGTDGETRAAPLVVRLWIADDGRITHSDFKSLGHAQADAELRELIEAEPFPLAPPADMLQPLVLGLAVLPSGPAPPASSSLAAR